MVGRPGGPIWQQARTLAVGIGFHGLPAGGAHGPAFAAQPEPTMFSMGGTESKRLQVAACVGGVVNASAVIHRQFEASYR